VSQILTFSRREELPQQPVNLRTLIEEALNLIRATLSSRIVVRSSIAGSAPIVLADPTQLQQVLINLATNAAHAMDDHGGEFVVAVDEVRVDATVTQQLADLRPGNYQRIDVSDTGTGMSPQIVERIFEPFFTTKAHGQGTGLGLAVVHGIVRSHGGAISVSSALGKGTTFSIYLPAIHIERTTAETKAPARERGQGQRILYVDDEEPLVYLITRVLERLGYRVSGFSDVRVALETFRINPSAFDAVVTDLSMPGMSGTEFARLVLQIRPDVPVVMTSGFVRSEDREQALKAGVRELLLKPNTVEALGDVLHRLLSAQ
jgi:CheY-like chemotaxis protein